MRRLGYRVVDMLVEHAAGIAARPVGHALDRATLEARLREPAPEKGCDPDALLDRLAADVFDAMVHVDHPRFFAYVPGPGSFVGAMGDALAAGFNVFAGAWAVASGPAMLEMVTIDWLRDACGMPATAGGLFLSGGSMANLTAIAVARHKLLGEETGDAVLYFSDQTHSSVARGARVLGFRIDQLRQLPSGDDQTLAPETLEAAIAEDRRNGRRPFCLIANAGTTSTGAVDPIAALDDLCRRHGLWLHVDGAYGAAAAIAPAASAMLGAIGLADSLTLDPHKWLHQPFECGCVLLREGRDLAETFRTVPAYLKDSDAGLDEINFRDHGVQLTRSFRALKLWMSIQLFGLRAFREGIERGIAMAERAEARLARLDGWRVVTPARLAIVTFRFEPAGAGPEQGDALAAAIIAELARSGQALLSSTVVNGRTVLRLCTINARTREADIDETVDLLDDIARRLLPAGF